VSFTHSNTTVNLGNLIRHYLEIVQQISSVKKQLIITRTQTDNKFELMLMRGVKAYSSPVHKLSVLSVYLQPFHCSSFLRVSTAADHKNQ